MNDRFKFRVFDKETGKYYKSRINKCSGRTLYQHPSSGHCQWVTISTLFAELEQDEKIYTRTGVEPDTIIEQSTGLSDKNGNLIYEGDIVRYSYSGKGVVRFGKYTGCFACGWENIYVDLFGWYLDDYYESDDCGRIRINPDDTHRPITEEDDGDFEIIGNVHEQAEQKDVK